MVVILLPSEIVYPNVTTWGRVKAALVERPSSVELPDINNFNGCDCIQQMVFKEGKMIMILLNAKLGRDNDNNDKR